MSLQRAVQEASALAILNNQKQVIGRIGGVWMITPITDEDTIFKMSSPLIVVTDLGIRPTFSMHAVHIEDDATESDISQTLKSVSSDADDPDCWYMDREYEIEKGESFTVNLAMVSALIPSARTSENASE